VLAVPNIFLSLQCHIQVPSIYADLRPELKSVKLMTAAVATAYLLCFVLYTTIAIFGLTTFRRTTQPNIMECGYDAHKIDIIIARVCLATTAVLSIPVNHHPAREAVWALMSQGSSEPMPTKAFITETCVFFGLVLVLGIFIDELSTLNDLMGLSAGVAVIFILPALFLWTDDPLSRGRETNGMSSMEQTNHAKTKKSGAVFFLAIGVITLIMSVHSFVGSEWLGVAPRGV